MTEAERTWTEIGEPWAGGERRMPVERAIESLQWRTPDGAHPMSQGLAVKHAIEELCIPKVTQVGYFSTALTYPDGLAETAHYDLLGIEGNYKNGRARIYLLDRGTGMTVLCSDFWPKEAEVCTT